MSTVQAAISTISAQTEQDFSTYIKETVQNHIQAVEDFFSTCEAELEEVTKTCAEALRHGHKIMLCGNGGSAADAQHIAAEFVGRLNKERKSLASIALTTDTSALTCIGNDYGFDQIFSRQVEGLGQEGDVLFAISTSGNSINVMNAARVAQEKGIAVVNFTGKDGGKMKHENLSTHTLHVQSSITAHVQECHMIAMHLLCALIEKELGLVS